MYFYCQNVISSNQHGFVRGRSTTTNLLELTSTVVRAFECRSQTDVVYTDFSKAFDRVNHQILLLKLERLGFPVWLTKWISSYLTGRTQQVLFNNYVSTTIHVTSGVPQGSHIGPLLFILFINDLPDYIQNSSVLLYADDCKIFCSSDNNSHYSALQDDLNLLSDWCLNNDMLLNSSKCYVMSYSRCRVITENIYCIGQTTLKRVSSFCDLGVIFDPKCEFNLHVDFVVNKCLSKLGCILRWSTEFNDDEIKKVLYCSHVRPHQEYCSEVWCPRYDVHINRVESVQKQFMIRAFRPDAIQGYELPPYKERLKGIGLCTLSDRRLIKNVLFMFNVFNGKVKSTYVLENSFLNVKLRPVRNIQDFKLLVTNTCTTNYLSFEPLTALSNDFNDLYYFIDFHYSIPEMKKILNNNFISMY